MTKNPDEMTVAELQAEIGRLQMALQRKVLGDPTGAVQGGSTISWPEWQLSPEAARDIEEMERFTLRGNGPSLQGASS